MVGFQNPNVSGEMAQLPIKNREKSVPVLQKDGKKMLAQTIFFDRDELTEERAWDVYHVFQDGGNGYDSLEKLDPVHSNWHAKLIFSRVIHIYNLLRSRTSFF